MEESQCGSQAGGVELLNAEPPWLAVYTRPRHEEKVRQYCGERGIVTFLPTFQSRRRWSDRTKVLMLPLFPSYIFVQPNASQRLRTQQAPGFLWFIHDRRGPVEVDCAELNQIRQAMVKGYRLDPLPGAEVGDEIEITAGPFRGCYGHLTSRSERELVLRISAINAAIRVRAPNPGWVRILPRSRTTPLQA